MKMLIPAVALLLLTTACASTPSVPFDCNQPLPERKGIVKVANPIAGRYIVVMKPDSQGAKLAVSDIDTFAKSFARVRDVKLYSRVLSGFSAVIDQSTARQMARGPRVAFVQEDGSKRVDPRVAVDAQAPPWGLDRSDQRSLPLDDAYQPDETGSRRRHPVGPAQWRLHDFERYVDGVASHRRGSGALPRTTRQW